MSRHLTTIRRAAVSGASSTFGLPPDLLANARKRLAGLAGLLAALSAVALVMGLFVFEKGIDPGSLALHICNLGLSAVLITLTLSKRVPTAVALYAGLAFEVTLCWGISFATHYGVLSYADEPPHITWTAMVIVIFPMIVPLPPGRMLVASTLSAISSPISLFAVIQAGVYEPVPSAYIGVSMSPAFAVLDFGLVKARAVSDELSLTHRDNIVGTPAFMAPEMASGAQLDGRADLYALGCVGYWLLTGHLVFEAETAMAIVAKHLQATPVPPSLRTEVEVPPDLEQVILDCLAKEPADRPGTAWELDSRLVACDVSEWTQEDAERWWRTCRPLGDNGFYT